MSEENDTPDTPETPEEDFASPVPEPHEEKDPPKKSSGGLKFLTLLMLLAAIALFVLPFVWGLDGKDKMKVIPDSSVLNDWLYWLGDLHLVILHIPIGIFVYVFVMELFGVFSFGKFKPRLRGALFLNAMFGIVAVVFGYFFFLRGEHGSAPIEFSLTGNNMGMHMWLSILFTALVILSFISKMWAHHQQKWSPFYPFFLIAAAASMVLGAHMGGQLVHPKKNIVDDFMSLKNGEPLGVAEEDIARLAPVTEIPAGDRLVYSQVVKPILYGKCWECHATADLNPLGKEKIKGELEMTSVAKILKGGEDQDHFPTLVEGNSEESEMMIRTNLDPETDDDFMPKGTEGKPEMRLTEGEKRILAWWIDTTPLIDEEGDKPLSEVAGHEAILADVEAFEPVREPAVVEKAKLVEEEKKEDQKIEEEPVEKVDPKAEVKPTEEKVEEPAVEEEKPIFELPVPGMKEPAVEEGEDTALGLKATEAEKGSEGAPAEGESKKEDPALKKTEEVPASGVDMPEEKKAEDMKPAGEEKVEDKPETEKKKSSAEEPAPAEKKEAEAKPAEEKKVEPAPASEKKEDSKEMPETAPEKKDEPAPASEKKEATEGKPEEAPAVKEEAEAKPATEKKEEPAPASEKKEEPEAMPKEAPAVKKETEGKPATEEKAPAAPATEKKDAVKTTPAPAEEKTKAAPQAPTPETIAPKEDGEEAPAPAKTSEKKEATPAPKAPEKKEGEKTPAPTPQKADEAPEEEKAADVMTPEERAREAIRKLREAANGGN